MKKLHKNLRKVLAIVLVCAMLTMSMGAYSGEVESVESEITRSQMYRTEIVYDEPVYIKTVDSPHLDEYGRVTEFGNKNTYTGYSISSKSPYDVGISVNAILISFSISGANGSTSSGTVEPTSADKDAIARGEKYNSLWFQAKVYRQDYTTIFYEWNTNNFVKEEQGSYFYYTSGSGQRNKVDYYCKTEDR